MVKVRKGLRPGTRPFWSRPAGWWWCNPPYGREIREWVAKAVDERGGCLLLPARVDTVWFHDHLYNEAAGAARPGANHVPKARFARRLRCGNSRASWNT